MKIIKVPSFVILAGILGTAGLIVIALVIKYAAPVPPAAEPLVNDNVTATQVQPETTTTGSTDTAANVNTTATVEIEEPQPTVSHTQYSGGEMLHLSSYQDSSAGTVPAVYSYTKPDFETSSLNWVGDKNDWLFGATDSTLFYANGIWGQTGYTIFSFDLASESSTELFTIPNSHSFYGALSPDGSQIVYLDRCGVLCDDESIALNSTMLLYDISSGTERELFSITDERQGFKAPRYWLDDETVVMERWFEGTEGSTVIQEYHLLNTATGEFQEYSLADNARSYSISPDQTRVAYTTLTWNESEDTTNSTLVVKTPADGTVETFADSNSENYKNVRWQDDQNLLVLTQDIEDVYSTLGTNVDGPHRIDSMSPSGSMSTLIEIGEPNGSVIFFDIVDNNMQYLVASVERGRAEAMQFRILDLSTFSEQTLLSMKDRIEPLGNIHKY